MASRWYELELLDNRYPALHGLRVLAILSVIQIHVTWIFSGEQQLPIDHNVTGVSLAIFFGMDLFFILSGFLIGSILFHSIDTAGKTQVGRFYLRRIFRTFPSYYVVLTFLATVTTLNAMQRSHVVYEYVYLTNFCSLDPKDIVMFWGWSLALEEQFYLVVPALLFLLTKLRTDRERVLLLIGICLIPLVVRISIYWSHYPWDDAPGALQRAIYFRTYSRFDTLIVGILLAFVHRRWGKDLAEWFKAPFHRALFAIPSLFLLWLLMFPLVVGIQNLEVFHLFAWGTITSVMYFPALLLLLHSDGGLQRWLGKPIFRKLATLGYGIYLVHIPLVYNLVVPWAHRLDERHVPRMVLWLGGLTVTVVCSLAIAYVLHVLIEKPSMRIRDRLAG